MKLNEFIEKILIYLSTCKTPLEDVLFHFIHKLKNIQKEHIGKYNRLYKIKDNVTK
jgi:hypothetical protein